MTSSKLAILALPIMAVGVLAADCSSTNLTNPKHDSGMDVPVVSNRDSGPDAPRRDSGSDVPVTSLHDSGQDTAADHPKDAADDAAMTLPPDSGTGGAAGHGGCSGHAPDPSETPPVHRPRATACAPTPFFFPDSGGTCTVSADCPSVPLSVVSTCLHGQCTPDQCLTDADCKPDEVCACNGGGPGGIGEHRNACVPAQCHVDADCGANGYCSPSGGYCGAIGGYFCHGPSDACVDGAKDCACGQTCQYTPTTGGFRCAAPSLCAG